MRPSQILLTLVTAAIALYGVVFLYEISSGAPGCCGATWPSADPLRAEQAVLRNDPHNRSAAIQRRTALAVLGGRPADSNGWLRLAYADRLEHGRLTDVGRQAFEMSYLVLPYGGSAAAPGRVAFALGVWSQVSPQTRRDALAEIGLARTESITWRSLRAAAAAVADPNGRLAAALMGLL